MQIEALRFRGAVRRLFERRIGAALPGKDAEVFLGHLQDEWVAGGAPHPAEKWIGEALEKLALAVGPMPAWVESITAVWPFLDGSPMLYLGMLTIPDTPTSRAYAAPSVALLLFGARVPWEGGWGMRYTVVEQHPGL